MNTERPDLVVIGKVQGEATAEIIKSRLEDEDIPVLLKYESLGRVFGLTVDGMGEIKILVPRHMAEKARAVLTDTPESEENQDD